MKLEIEGHPVLVTGGNRGIGLAIARRCATFGARIGLVARNQTTLSAAKDSLLKDGADSVETFACDLSDASAIGALTAEVDSRLGRPEVLINNAGLYKREWITKADPTVWDGMLDLNLRAPMRLVQWVLPSMIEQRRGAIINVGSIAGLDGFPLHSGYCASKFGLRGFTQALFQEVRKFGILVSYIAPGFVATEMTEDVRGADRSRMLGADDVADAVAYILSVGANAAPTELVVHTQWDAFGD